MSQFKLNSEQQKAVEHLNGPMLVVAGAGTGKTQVVTQRIARLISEHKVSPAEILAITFTEKAANEMQSRVSELLGRYVLDVKITTFNSFGYDLLKRFAYDIGITPDVNVLSETQQLIFLRQNLDKLKLKYYAPLTGPESLLGDLARYFSKLKSQIILPHTYNLFAKKLQKKASDKSEIVTANKHLELAGSYEAYEKLSREQNVIDFDDQVYLAVRLLRDNPDLLSKLQNEIKYVLVDEFQDTNRAQGELIDLLVSKGSNLMVVGDDDQCIYRFRGAQIENILEFEQRYPNSTGVALRQNYRSSQLILDAAHKLIEHNNPDRLESLYEIDKNLVAQFKGKKPELKSFGSIEEEAAWIADDIAKKVHSGVAQSDIAILLRKNSQAKILERYLSAIGVDSYFVGQNQDLYQQPAVKIMLNFLRCIVDPRDDTSLYHLLSSPIYRVSPGTLRNYSASAQRLQISLSESIKQNESKGSDLAGIIEQIENWREQLNQENVGRLAYAFLEKTEYLKTLLSAATEDKQADQNIMSLNQFFTTLLGYERVAEDTTAVGYVNALPILLGAGERLSIDELPELFTDKVRLISVHRAKGLEFELVYLFDMTQGTFPSINRHDSLEVPAGLTGSEAENSTKLHIQEERRLMYVAMTRAKRELTMTYSVDHGGKRAWRPSMFLGEAFGEVVMEGGGILAKRQIDQIELFATPAEVEKIDVPWRQGDKLTLSAVQIETYLRCPAEFKLRFILNPPQMPSFSLSYGSLMHTCFQLYNQSKIDKKTISLERLQAHIKSNWPKEGFVYAEHSKRGLEQAISTITRFYKREEYANRHPEYVERAFEVPFSEINVVLVGRFDAVYQDSKGVEIRDYKTGASTITDEKSANARAATSQQLALYALAWEQMNGKSPDLVTLDFVDVGFIGVAKKTERQLKTIEEKIKTVAEGIRSNNFTPGSSHQFCTHMEYGF